MSKSKIFSVFLLVFFILSSLLLANEITVKHSLGRQLLRKIQKGLLFLIMVPWIPWKGWV